MLIPRRLAGMSRCLVLVLISVSLIHGDHVQADGVTVNAPDGRLGAVEAFRTDQTTLAYDAGVRWERLTFWWKGLQSGPGQPLNPFYLPLSYIDQERAHGIKVVGVLVNTPDWAAADPSQGGKSPPKNLNLAYNDPNNYWGQFVRQVVKMYAGHVDTWIIWNEPDITPDAPNAAYYLWSGSPADYYQLLKVAYINAHEVNPSVQISDAAVTYWTDIHMQREQWFSRFLEQVAADPTAAAHNQYFDFTALNLYTNPEDLYTVPNLYHQLMQEKGFDKPIWITETNVIPYDDPVNAATANGTAAEMRASLTEQANYVLEAIAMGLAAGSPKIEVYKMKDGDGDVVNGEALVRADYSKRPEYYAFQVAAQYFTNFRSATLFVPGDLREVVFDRGPSRVTVLWDAAPTPISVRVPAAGTGQTQEGGPLGNFQVASASNGSFVVNLAGATMHTDLTNPTAYLIGGTPVVLVESGVSGAVTQATNLSPATLAPFRPIAARVAGQLGSGSLPGEGVVAAASQTVPAYPSRLDYGVSGGHFYGQANGLGGLGGTGYTIVDSSQANFWSVFQADGGVATLGYPSSQSFTRGGFVYQTTQRALLQWQADGVHFANIFDMLAAAGKDGWLLSQFQVPKSQSWSSDAGKTWPDVVANHLAILDQAPAIKAAYMADADYLDHFGLPMAIADEGNVVVVRCQRVVFQLWKQDVPWAKAGQVTVALGGDIAKQAGLVPQAAQTPQ